MTEVNLCKYGQVSPSNARGGTPILDLSGMLVVTIKIPDFGNA